MSKTYVQMSNGAFAYLLIMTFLLGGWVASLIGILLAGIW